MTSALDEKLRNFDCFFQSGRAKDLSAPLYLLPCMFEVIKKLGEDWWDLHIAWESEKSIHDVVGEFANGKTIWKTFVQVGGWLIKFVFDTLCVKV